MGWLDNLFGAGAKQRDATAAYNDSQATLSRGLADAKAALQGSTDSAKSAINTGYDQAGSVYDRALPGLRNDITQGYQGAESAITGAVDKANATLDPFVQSGRRAQDAYDAALGGDTSGYAAYRGGFGDYTNFADEMAVRAADRGLNAGGVTGGRAALVKNRVVAERANNDIQQYLTRLETAGARGGQYAGQQGQNTMTGGQIVAQNRANQGSALANLGTHIADAQSGLATGRATNLASIDSGQGSALAGLISGNAQQSAANRINLGNVYAQTRGSGAQNLINLAGTAAQAYGAYNNPYQPRKAP